MPEPSSFSKQDFERLADFRYRLRRFQRFSEEAAQRHGITMLQYLLLLQIKGFPGRDWATVAELAERLQSHHHSVVGLISRCEQQQLVARSPGGTTAAAWKCGCCPRARRWRSGWRASIARSCRPCVGWAMCCRWTSCCSPEIDAGAVDFAMALWHDFAIAPAVEKCREHTVGGG